MLAMAQRVEVVAVNRSTGEVSRNTTADSDVEDLYIAIFAYGLPRDMVRTNMEMQQSMYSTSTYSTLVLTATGGYIGATGVTQRHHTTKGIDEPITTDGNDTDDEGHNVNHKITFAYLIAPYNVDSSGNQDTESTTILDWCVASGWDITLLEENGHTGSSGVSGDGIGPGKGAYTLPADPTGCAAYQGIGGNDPKGSWRLPTQRESQVMFTIIEQAMELSATYSLDVAIVSGDYWTSTEFFAASTSPWKAWANNSISGSVTHLDKTTGCYARCIRDIYYNVNDK